MGPGSGKAAGWVELSGSQLGDDRCGECRVGSGERVHVAGAQGWKDGEHWNQTRKSIIYVIVDISHMRMSQEFRAQRVTHLGFTMK